MGLVYLLALLSCAKQLPPIVLDDPPTVSTDAAPGLIGMRFRQIPEGMLIISVAEGMGAADAGLVTGDLVIAVDGVPVAGLPVGDARQRVVGPPNTTVELSVQGPLGGPVRAVTVERRPRAEMLPPRGATPTPPPRPAEEILAFRQAIRRGRPSEVVPAIDALVAADFGGERAGDVIGGPLRVAAEQNRKNAEIALDRLVQIESDDWTFYAAVGEGAARAGQPRRAVKQINRAEALRPPDHQPIAGKGGDLGGAARMRRLKMDALVEVGRADEARELAGVYLRTHPRPSVANQYGAKLPEGGRTWSARLPPVPPFEVSLLSGESWSLADARGDVVMLTFWATWCGPCREEMPELEQMYRRRVGQDVRFLAVSIDEPGAGDKIDEKISEWGVTFPVTHAPALGQDFGVSAIPAIRVLNRQGALHYASRGYSPSSVDAVDAQIEVALAEEATGQTALGTAWSAPGGSASLQQFLPMGGVFGVAGRGAHVVVGVEGSPPMSFTGTLPATVEATVDPVPDVHELVAWLDGPVATGVRGLMVRAWGEDGFPRWSLATPGAIFDIAATEKTLWVATAEGAIQLSSDGAVLAHHPEMLITDLAAGADGVWGLSGTQRWWLPDVGPPEQQADALEVSLIDEAGGAISLLTNSQSVVSGRFGEDGQPRTVSVRKDGMIVGLSADGLPSFTWKLSQPARLSAADLDQDGHDELLVAIERQGLAVVRLSMP
ncbi:MAG: redoxin domain-containing protein [Myxococcota bacterium]